MKPVLNLLALALLISSSTFGQDEPKPEEIKKLTPEEEAKQQAIIHAVIVNALQTGDVEKFLKLTAYTKVEHFKGMRASILHRRGEQRFFNADIKGSLADFDEVIALEPKRDPYHWQRGISYYYAEKYQEGKEQFERHQEVNSQDVENAVWHFLCSVRAPGGSIESARKNLIPISKDTRVPMKQIQALFAGSGSVEDVLKAAKKEGNPAKSAEAKNAFLYAHLYLGIYFEAIGKDELMKEHISKAVGDYKMDHYMGKVAQVHAKLRGLSQ
jgi:lipoprotein NlpI